MKFEKPGLAAFLVASISSIGSLIILVWFGNTYKVLFPLWQLLLAALLLGLTTYHITFFTINQFIYNKVKLIFKTIHEIRAGSDQEEDKIARSTSLYMAEKEVAEWAEERKAEIKRRSNRRLSYNFPPELYDQRFNEQTTGIHSRLFFCNNCSMVICAGSDQYRVSIFYLDRSCLLSAVKSKHI